MKRIPIIPTIIVVAAIAIMTALGVWQLERAEWKKQLLAEYASADRIATTEWPLSPDPENLPLFRKSQLDCAAVTDWRSTSGRSRNNTPGIAHIANCNIAGAKGKTAQVVVGWSKSPQKPDWNGGLVSGTIGPDSNHLIRLIADTPVDGLRPNAPPSLDNIPNNHLAYAMQWFFFAAIAGIIYMLALRKRRKANEE